MNDRSLPSASVDPLVASSKREALFAAALWLAAVVYTVGYCAWRGYDRTAEDLTFVFGIPDWVFWGIVAPWTFCTVVSIWFALRVMRDDPLGDEAAVDPADLDDTEAGDQDAAAPPAVVAPSATSGSSTRQEPRDA